MSPYPRVKQGYGGERTFALGEADLLQEEAVVVLEVLLDDLAVLPTSDGREDDLERLAGRFDDRPIPQLERLRERPGERCDKGRALAISEQDVVGMLDLVVGERCAEPLGLSAVIRAATRGSAFAPRPVDDDVALVVVGVEGIPVTRVPGLIQRVHALEV